MIWESWGGMGGMQPGMQPFSFRKEWEEEMKEWF